MWYSTTAADRYECCNRSCQKDIVDDTGKHAENKDRYCTGVLQPALVVIFYRPLPN